MPPIKNKKKVNKKQKWGFNMFLKFSTALVGIFILFSQPAFALDEGEAAYNAGMRAYNRQEFQNAVFAFENSISYDPSLYKSYCMLAMSYILNDEPARGVKTYREAIQKFPTEWNAYILLAEYYETQQNHSEALSYYLQASDVLHPKEAKKYIKKINDLKEKQKEEWTVSESEKEKIISNILTPLDLSKWRVALVEKKETAVHVVYALKSENYKAGKWSQILDITCTYMPKQDKAHFDQINEWMATNYRRNNADMDTIVRTDISRLYEVNMHEKKTQIIGHIFPAPKGFCIAQFNYKKLSAKEKENWIDDIRKINVRNF